MLWATLLSAVCVYKPIFYIFSYFAGKYRIKYIAWTSVEIAY